MGRLSHSLLCCLALLPTALTTAMPSLSTSERSIRKNAFQIFNAVHSAVRQWGSSLNHNGMSFFLATVPEGQLLYHGCGDPGWEKGFDWLAFEIEHAQAFAQSWDPDAPDVRLPPWPPCKEPPDGVPPSGNAQPTDFQLLEEFGWEKQAFRRSTWPRSSFQPLQHHEDQNPILGNEDDDNDKPCLPPDVFKRHRGYFHTYRATRPLRLLYVDGMAAAKVNYGTLDTQDLILLGWPDNNTLFDTQRAAKLCALAEAWAREYKDGSRIDGFVRMEAGFEIIYCEFAEGSGLELVSVRASPFWNETGWFSNARQVMEWSRGATMRNHGLPKGRIDVDWSSMVSAFFYDVNLTNPDPSRPELPRVASTTEDERREIRARVREVIAARHWRPDTIDWQSIVDMIVSRYANRLEMLANGTAKASKSLVDMILDPYIDYKSTEALAPLLERCTRHYIESAIFRESSWTPEDRSIYTAIETVTREICSSFIQLRDILHNSTDEDRGEIDIKENDEEVSEKVHKVARDLMMKLQWTTWKECGKCSSADEFCFVAMFPFGSVEDHFSPRCKMQDIMPGERNYWAGKAMPSGINVSEG